MSQQLVVVRDSCGGAPCAVLGAATAVDTPVETTWCGQLDDLEAIALGGKLLPSDAVFCAELTARWRRLVVGTPAFVQAMRAGEACPPGFLLEVLS